MNISELLDIRKCNCGRMDCEFFSPGEGDNGRSYSREQIESLQEQLALVPSLELHLKELLK